MSQYQQTDETFSRGKNIYWIYSRFRIMINLTDSTVLNTEEAGGIYSRLSGSFTARGFTSGGSHQGHKANKLKSN